MLGFVLMAKSAKDVEEYCVSEGWVKVPAGQNPGSQRAAFADEAQRHGGGVLPLIPGHGPAVASCGGSVAR